MYSRQMIPFLALAFMAFNAVAQGFPTVDFGAVTNSQAETALEDWLAATKQLPGAAPDVSNTIAAGVMTPTGPFVVVSPESGNTDDLTHLSLYAYDGAFIALTSASGKTITVKHGQGGTGQIRLAGDADFAMTDEDLLWLRRDGTAYQEFLRGPPVARPGRQVFTNSGTFTVPAGVTQLHVRGIGGGGGGGGGGSQSGSSGGNGSAGGTTSLGLAFTAAGGGGGFGGASGTLDGNGGGGGTPNGLAGLNLARAMGVIGSSAGPKTQHTAFGTYGAGGAGGNGSGGDGTNQGGPGGGGGTGTYVESVISVTPGQSLSVTIGAGGAAGTHEGAGSAPTAGGPGYLVIAW